jgi:hypothetical protein
MKSHGANSETRLSESAAAKKPKLSVGSHSNLQRRNFIEAHTNKLEEKEIT